MKESLGTIVLTILLLQPISAALAWELERPADVTSSWSIDQRAENSYTNGEASVMLGVDISRYHVNFGAPYGNDDVLSMNISAPANSRKGIEYDQTVSSLVWRQEVDLNPRNVRVGVGDDWGSYVDFPPGFIFRFFGGFDSGEYSRAWVCSNGFISFDISESTSNSPSDIPSPSSPNAMIAGVWADLSVDSSASIVTGLYEAFSHREFVIIWKNVLHKASGIRLTFQIILEEAPGFYPVNLRYSQGYIRLSYYSVNSINTPFANGMEDHEGYKGFGGLWEGSLLGSLNKKTIEYYQFSNSYFLKSLTIEFYDPIYDSSIDILEEQEKIGGYHLKYDQTPIPDQDLTFFKALAGTASLGITIGGLLFNVATIGVTLPITCILITHSWVDLYARGQCRPVTVLSVSDYPNRQSASIKALTADYVVDASLSISAFWLLKTPNTQRHSLTITAKAEYYEYSRSDGSIINKNPVTTSVNLNIGPDNNNNRANAKQIDFGTTYYWQWIGGYDQVDWFSVNPSVMYNVEVTVSATSAIKPDFDLYLQDQQGNTIDSSTERGIYTKHVSGFYVLAGPGPWYVKVDWYSPGNVGFYKIHAETWYSGGGGGCPYVSVWNGTRYVLDNNVIPAAEGSNGTDVLDYYMLQQPLIRNNGKYSLLIWDLDKHSFLDQVELLAVDHELDVNVAVSPGGDVLTYKTPANPVSVINMKGLDVTAILSAVDDNYYEGYAGDYLLFDFGDLDVSQGAKLVLRTDILCEPKPCEESIHIQVLNAKGEWVDVASFIPRVYWSTDILDLSGHLPDVNGDTRVRLYFTADHKIDYVGLDTTKQGEFQLTHGNLATANHTRLDDVKELFQNSDNLYVELLPGEQVTLQFTLPQNLKKERDFIIILEGHYFLVN